MARDIRTKSSVMLVSAAVPLARCAPRVDEPEDVQAIRQTTETYSEAVNAKDAPASVAMLSDRTVYMEPGETERERRPETMPPTVARRASSRCRLPSGRTVSAR